MSIAAAILERVQAENERNANLHVTKVGIKVGAISGVDADSLAFGFEVLVKDSPLEPLSLEIEHCPRVQRCPACAREFAAGNFQTECPGCGNPETLCIAGEELDIAYMEVEEQ